MHQPDGRLEALVGYVEKVAPDLIWSQHALVNDGPRGKAGRIEENAVLEVAAVADGILGTLADDVELALEGQFVVAVNFAAADKGLALEGLARFGGVAQCRVVGRHVAPAQKLLPLFGDDLLESLLAGFAVAGAGRQEKHCHAVGTRFRQLEIADAGEEFVRDLQ